MIRAIVKRPDEEIGHVTNVNNRLEQLQKTVGGYIETVTIKRPEIDEDGIVIICNEEGNALDLPYNCTVRVPWLQGRIGFVGTIVVVGCNDEEFTDLPEWLTRKEWAKWLK